MLKRTILIWLLGLFTIVPYSVYYLFVHASREQYAFLIVFPLFWIFGYWGVVTPILSAIKVRRFFKLLEKAGSREEFIRVIEAAESQEAVIDLIASENGIPRFLARRVLNMFMKRYSAAAAAE